MDTEERIKGGNMKESITDWAFVFGICLSISWLGALAIWAFPNLATSGDGFSTFPPFNFGLYFSGVSFICCGLGWLLCGRNDC